MGARNSLALAYNAVTRLIGLFLAIKRRDDGAPSQSHSRQMAIRRIVLQEFYDDILDLSAGDIGVIPRTGVGLQHYLEIPAYQADTDALIERFFAGAHLQDRVTIIKLCHRGTRE